MVALTAKPVVFDPFRLATPKCWVRFQTEKSSFLESVKQSGTGRITALVKHYGTPTTVSARSAPSQPSAIAEPKPLPEDVGSALLAAPWGSSRETDGAPQVSSQLGLTLTCTPGHGNRKLTTYVGNSVVVFQVAQSEVMYGRPGRITELERDFQVCRPHRAYASTLGTGVWISGASAIRQVEKRGDGSHTRDTRMDARTALADSNTAHHETESNETDAP